MVLAPESVLLETAVMVMMRLILQKLPFQAMQECMVKY